MRLFSAVCAVICIGTTIIVYSLFSNAPKVIRGDDKILSLSAQEINPSYTIEIKNINFTNTSNARIKLVSIPSNQSARVDAIYSEDLDSYAFVVDMTNDHISLSMESDDIHPIQTFDVTIYAPISFVKVDGSGYSVSADVALTQNFSLYISGEVTVNVSLSDALGFTLASAGSSFVEVSGKAKNSIIGISGSGLVDAGQFVSDSATVRISGSGNTGLAVKHHLDVVLKGSSSLSYWGNPELGMKNIDKEAQFVQVSEAVPVLANY